MSGFLNKLVISPTKESTEWELDAPLYYNTGSGDIRIPKGFVTDFASIPRVFWVVLPKWGDYGRAAVLHDYLYESKIYTRELSDKIFLNAMKDDNVNFSKRQFMYRAVRLFGSIAWNRKSVKD